MEKTLFSTEDLIPRLQSEFGYPKSGARLVASKLVACNPVIQTSFWTWWQTGKLNFDMEVGSYTIKRLMQEHQMKPIAAFLTMDWLLREPEKATQSLRRGHDRIIEKKNQ